MTGLQEKWILHPDDLEINQLGELSSRQKQDLKFHIAFWIFVAVVETSTLLTYIYFQFVFQDNWLIGIFLFMLLISLTYMCFINARPYWRDLKNNKVKTLAGNIFKGFSRSGASRSGPSIGYCSVQIGKQAFSVSPDVYTSVIQDEVYRLYYLPYTHTLVNIEFLG